MGSLLVFPGLPCECGEERHALRFKTATEVYLYWKVGPQGGKQTRRKGKFLLSNREGRPVAGTATHLILAEVRTSFQPFDVIGKKPYNGPHPFPN